MGILKCVNEKKMIISSSDSNGIDIRCKGEFELAIKLTEELNRFDGKNIRTLYVDYGFKRFNIIKNFKFDAKQHMLLFSYLNGYTDPEVKYLVNNGRHEYDYISKPFDIDYDTIDIINDHLLMLSNPWSESPEVIECLKSYDVGFYVDLKCKNGTFRFFTNEITANQNGLFIITDQYGGCHDMKCIEYGSIESISIKNYK